MPEDHPATSTRPANLRLYAATAGLLAVFAIIAAAFLGAQYAIPIVILAALLLGFFALNDLTARRVLQRHDGDALAVQDDQTETTPTAHVIPDETALGDTAEAHAEISPHDVPKGSPIRKAIEHQARQHPRGTTRGNANGADGGPQLAHDDAPPSRDEGCEDDHTIAAPSAR
jgi:hypothetical protein